MLNATAKVDVVPEAYRVTVVNPEKNITVCPDSEATVNADINIEKISGYSGFYPGKPNDQYKLVKKHMYKKAERKIRHVEKKEAKVARITKSAVDVKTDAPVKA